MENTKFIVYCNQRFYLQSSGRYYQSGEKTDAERLLHRRVWSDVHGPIPVGHEIHHKNDDWTDSCISNLECLDAVEHQRRHMLEKYKDPEFKAARLRDLAAAQEAAKAWHASEEGLKWHSENGKKVWANKVAVAAKCSVCGTDYETFFPDRSRFCSRACEQKEGYQRYKTTSQNCVLCGSLFVFNKYRTQECCSRACGNKLRSMRERGIAPP